MAGDSIGTIASIDTTAGASVDAGTDTSLRMFD